MTKDPSKHQYVRLFKCEEFRAQIEPQKEEIEELKRLVNGLSESISNLIPRVENTEHIAEEAKQNAENAISIVNSIKDKIQILSDAIIELDHDIDISIEMVEEANARSIETASEFDDIKEEWDIYKKRIDDLEDITNKFSLESDKIDTCWDSLLTIEEKIKTIERTICAKYCKC